MHFGESTTNTNWEYHTHNLCSTPLPGRRKTMVHITSKLKYSLAYNLKCKEQFMLEKTGLLYMYS